MPILEDYGTLKNVSFSDRWTVGHTIAPFTNYDKLSVNSQTTLFETPFLLFPLYWFLKLESGSSGSWALRIRTGTNQFNLTIEPTRVGWGSWYAVDMTTARALELLVNKDSDMLVYVDGVYALAVTPSTDPNPPQLRITSGVVSNPMLFFQQRVHRNPQNLIDYYWQEFLRKRVMDPSDRDDPADFIRRRYPVATWPTEMTKPQIDYYINHRPKPQFHPTFPHFYVNSDISVNFYIGVDQAVNGLQNTDVLDEMHSLIVEALNFVYDDIPILRNYTVSNPRFTMDERNKMWKGTLKISADHLVEVF